MFEESHAKFATNRRSQVAFQKVVKEWEIKNPIKALKQRIKRFLGVNR